MLSGARCSGEHDDLVACHSGRKWRAGCCQRRNRYTTLVFAALRFAPSEIVSEHGEQVIREEAAATCLRWRWQCDRDARTQGPLQRAVSWSLCPKTARLLSIWGEAPHGRFRGRRWSS